MSEKEGEEVAVAQDHLACCAMLFSRVQEYTCIKRLNWRNLSCFRGI